jgi:hypothetical protein
LSTEEERARWRAASKKWRQEHPEEVKARNARGADKRAAAQRADQAENPDKYLGYHLRRQYGITVAEYDEMLMSCGYKCEICGTPVQRARWKGVGGQSACIDHCHSTGRIRGVLCRQCNSWLGRVNDKPEAAVAYLNRK